MSTKSACERCNSCRFWYNGYCDVHKKTTNSQSTCNDFEED